MPYTAPMSNSNAATRYWYNLADYTGTQAVNPAAIPATNEGENKIVTCLKKELAARVASLVFAAVATADGIVRETTAIIDSLALAIANRKIDFLRNAGAHLAALIIGTFALPIIGIVGFVLPSLGGTVGDVLDGTISTLASEFFKAIEVKKEDKEGLILGFTLGLMEDIRKISGHLANILESPFLSAKPKEASKAELDQLNELRKQRMQAVSAFFRARFSLGTQS